MFYPKWIITSNRTKFEVTAVNKFRAEDVAKSMLSQSGGVVVSIERKHNRRGYNPVAVNKAIQASNRAGQKIGGQEARAIHALLKGR